MKLKLRGEIVETLEFGDGFVKFDEITPNTITLLQGVSARARRMTVSYAAVRHNGMSLSKYDEMGLLERVPEYADTRPAVRSPRVALP